MKPMKAAATAESRTNWTRGLRITEAAGLPITSRQGKATNSVETLQTLRGTLQLAWRWVEQKRSQQLSSRRMRVAESISLGEKRTISIVVVDGAQYLIGSSSGGVQLLTKLERSGGPASCHEVAF